jgi:hypothetical protein
LFLCSCPCFVLFCLSFVLCTQCCLFLCSCPCFVLFCLSFVLCTQCCLFLGYTRQKTNKTKQNKDNYRETGNTVYTRQNCSCCVLVLFVFVYCLVYTVLLVSL